MTYDEEQATLAALRDRTADARATLECQIEEARQYRSGKPKFHLGIDLETGETYLVAEVNFWDGYQGDTVVFKQGVAPSLLWGEQDEW